MKKLYVILSDDLEFPQVFYLYESPFTKKLLLPLQIYSILKNKNRKNIKYIKTPIQKIPCFKII